MKNNNIGNITIKNIENSVLDKSCLLSKSDKNKNTTVFLKKKSTVSNCINMKKFVNIKKSYDIILNIIIISTKNFNVNGIPINNNISV